MSNLGTLVSDLSIDIEVECTVNYKDIKIHF